MRAARHAASLVLVVAIFGCQRSGGTAPAADSFEGMAQQGQEALAQGQFQKAQTLFEQALQMQPQSAEANNLLGMALRFQFNQTQNPEFRQKEIGAFRKAVELRPDFVVALVNLGSSLYTQGQKQEAAAFFKRALEKMPAHPQAAELKKMIQEAEGEAPPVSTPVPAAPGPEPLRAD